MWKYDTVGAVSCVSERIVRYENKLVDCDSKSIVSTYNLMLLLFHEQTHTLTHDARDIFFPAPLRFCIVRVSKAYNGAK